MEFRAAKLQEAKEAVVNSVGRAFGILKGYQSGDTDEAEGFLKDKSPGQIRAQARSESKTNSRPKFYKKYRMGVKVY